MKASSYLIADSRAGKVLLAIVVPLLVVGALAAGALVPVGSDTAFVAVETAAALGSGSKMI